jgi:hypothetical protein
VADSPNRLIDFAFAASMTLCGTTARSNPDDVAHSITVQLIINAQSNVFWISHFLSGFVTALY